MLGLGKLIVIGLGLSSMNSLDSEHGFGLGSALGTRLGASLGWLGMELVWMLGLVKLIVSGLGL